MKAIDIIRPIGDNLSRREAEILQTAVDQIQDARKREFKAYLKRVSQIVERWPPWKQNILGRIKTSVTTGTKVP